MKSRPFLKNARPFRFFPSIVTGALQALLGTTRRAEEERQEEEESL